MIETLSWFSRLVLHFDPVKPLPTHRQIVLAVAKAVGLVAYAIYPAIFLLLVYFESEPLLRRDPTPESLATISGVLLEPPRGGCTNTISKKRYHEFGAAIQTASGVIEMYLPCYGDVDARALGQTLMVHYVKGTDFVGRPYEVVWEMHTPAHVYLDFARRQQDEMGATRSRFFGRPRHQRPACAPSIVGMPILTW